MTEFYTFFGSDWNNVLVRGYRDGKQFQEKIAYQPTLFVPDPTNNSDIHTIDGKAVKPVTFDSMKAAREFTQQFDNVPNFKLYGLNHFPYVYIYEKYGSSDLPYDQSLIRILDIDIETDSQDGYGDVDLADREINLVQMKVFGSKELWIYGLEDYTPQEEELTSGKWKINFVKCRNERDILLHLIERWVKINPDVVTGWNIQMFDIRYIIKRMRMVGDSSWPKKLSPFGMITEKEVMVYGKPKDVYEIVGVSTLDYLEIYRKFSFSNEESYSLAYITSKHLGVSKLDYSEYGTLARLYNENYNKFVDYGAIDIIRVEELNNKLRFFDQVFGISYMSMINYTDTFTTIRNWDILVHHFLLDQNIVVPYSSYNSKEGQISGGYVKDPQIGKHDWVMSFDFKSLYPHLIMTFNLSPETYVGKIEGLGGPESVDKIIDGFLNEYHDKLVSDNVCVSGKGTIFRRDKQGVIPAIMEKLFNERARYSALENEYTEQLAAIRSEMTKRGIEIPNDD